MKAHLGYSKNQKRSDQDNARNGYGKKKIKTQHGEFDIDVPRDRKSEFEPQIVPKRSQLSEGIENLIISLYAKGMSNSDIEAQLNELYGLNVSTTTISVVTDKIHRRHHRMAEQTLRIYLFDSLDGCHSF